MAETKYTKFAAHFDNMSWPLPQDNLEWTLRYGEPTRSDLLTAAGILGAYEQMIFDPEKKRREVIRHLRNAYEEREQKCDE